MSESAQVISFVVLVLGLGGAGVFFFLDAQPEAVPKVVQSQNMPGALKVKADEEEIFGSGELTSVAKAMVVDMVKAASAEGVFDNRTPALALRKFKNDSGEKVDMQKIQDRVRTQLLRSRKFNFTTEQEKLKGLLEEDERQRDSGLYKVDASKGRWTPPQFLVRGRLSAIKKENEDVKDVYFLFTLYLDNSEASEAFWSIEKELPRSALR